MAGTTLGAGSRRLDHRVLALSTILLAACTMHWGPRPDRIGELVQPAGVMVELRLQNPAADAAEGVSGELLEVRDEGVVLLTDHIVMVAYGAIREIRSDEHPLVRNVEWTRRPDQVASALKPASRYPRGMDARVLERLLAALDQPDVTRIER